MFCRSSFLLIVLVVWPGVVAAMVQCIKMSPSTVCNASIDCHNVSDCFVDCAGQTLVLTGRCSDLSGVADDSVAENITFNTDVTQNKYCWCRALAPVTSGWVLRYAYSSGAVCSQYCTRGCANGFLFDEGTDSRYRERIFGNLEDVE